MGMMIQACAYFIFVIAWYMYLEMEHVLLLPNYSDGYIQVPFILRMSSTCSNGVLSPAGQVPVSQRIDPDTFQLDFAIAYHHAVRKTFPMHYTCTSMFLSLHAVYLDKVECAHSWTTLQVLGLKMTSFVCRSIYGTTMAMTGNGPTTTLTGGILTLTNWPGKRTPT